VRRLFQISERAFRNCKTGYGVWRLTSSRQEAVFRDQAPHLNVQPSNQSPTDLLAIPYRATHQHTVLIARMTEQNCRPPNPWRTPNHDCHTSRLFIWFKALRPSAKGTPAIHFSRPGWEKMKSAESEATLSVENWTTTLPVFLPTTPNLCHSWEYGHPHKKPLLSGLCSSWLRFCLWGINIGGTMWSSVKSNQYDFPIYLLLSIFSLFFML